MLQFISGVGSSNQSKINKHDSSFFHMLNQFIFNDIFGFEKIWRFILYLFTSSTYICEKIETLNEMKNLLISIEISNHPKMCMQNNHPKHEFGIFVFLLSTIILHKPYNRSWWWLFSATLTTYLILLPLAHNSQTY